MPATQNRVGRGVSGTCNPIVAVTCLDVDRRSSQPLSPISFLYFVCIRVHLWFAVFSLSNDSLEMATLCVPARSGVRWDRDPSYGLAKRVR